MRCPLCRNFCGFSFHDEVNGVNVYQCGTVGVETSRSIGPRTHLIHTLDHSENFYKFEGGRMVRVLPVRLGKEASEAVLKHKGWTFVKDEFGHKVVPTVWASKVA